MRISQVIIFVKDLKRMASFYSGIFGFDLEGSESGKGWIRFESGGCSLALHAIPEPKAAQIRISDPPEARTDNPIKLAFHVEDIDAEREALMARGAFMLEVRRFPGLALCNGLDPEGNVFQLTTH